jgi:NTP pyrophosphatase (non-canonical NTP hydrolase)
MKREPLEVIQETLIQEELLCQLAEEASELAKAALKLRRAYNGTNPTPVTEREAYDALLEEIADVNVCILALELDRGFNFVQVSKIMHEKLERWAGRLEEAGK